MPSLSIEKKDKGWITYKKGGEKFKFSIRQLNLSGSLSVENLPRAFYFDKNRESQSKVGFNTTMQKLVQEYNWRYRKSLEKEVKNAEAEAELNRKNEITKKWNEFYSAVFGYVDKSKLKDTFEPLRNIMSEFLGEHYKSLELSLLDLSQPFDKAFLSLRDGFHQIRHTEMGSGISIILSYFLLEIISLLSKESLIFLIDEPEIHLHPQLQHKLRKHFACSESQTIISTHSESMVNIGEWRSIKRFNLANVQFPSKDILQEKVLDKTLEIHLDEIKKFSHDKTIFFRENSEIFFSRLVILVEGPIDKYGI
jgi:predicted ATP-dependent endonuclease of OLD family